MDGMDADTKNEMLVVAAYPENVEQVIHFVTNFVVAAGGSESVCNQLSVCVDEVFANIAQYAYAGTEGKLWVDIKRIDEPAQVQITFRDQGIAFNSLDREDPDVTLPLEERAIGGLGIYITKKLADQVSYERRDDYNVLTIVKTL